MKFLLIDDDPSSLSATRQILERYPQTEQVDTVSDMDQLRASLAAGLPDAVFIDVEMGDLTGFEVASYLQKHHPGLPYVFLTGHTEWALKGYDFSPLDFLAKPISPFRLEQTLEKLAALRAPAPAAERGDRRVCLMVNQGYEIVSLGDILYIERVSRKVCIHRKNGPPITVNDTMQNMEAIFAERKLFRCHKSVLVPLDSIVSIRTDMHGSTYSLILRDCQEQIPLSRHVYPELKQALEANGLAFH